MFRRLHTDTTFPLVVYWISCKRNWQQMSSCWIQRQLLDENQGSARGWRALHSYKWLRELEYGYFHTDFGKFFHWSNKCFGNKSDFVGKLYTSDFRPFGITLFSWINIFSQRTCYVTFCTTPVIRCAYMSKDRISYYKKYMILDSLNILLSSSIFSDSLNLLRF